MPDTKTPPKAENDGRRSFLKFAAVAAPAAAVSGVAGTAQAGPVEPDTASVRLQDTAHTRAYYDSARF